MFRNVGPNELLLLLEGAKWTLALSATAFLGGGLLGLIVALCRTAQLRITRFFAAVYIQVVQGTPLLGQLFVFFFGFSILGYDVSAYFASATALIFFSGAFLGEIWRGCIQAVPRAQSEASESLGLGRYQTLRHVVLPQAVRVAVPPTVGFSVQIIKNTSLCALVGFVELLRSGQMVTASTFEPLTVYLLVALLYFCMCYPLSVWSSVLERKLNVAHSH